MTNERMSGWKERREGVECEERRVAEACLSVTSTLSPLMIHTIYSLRLLLLLILLLFLYYSILLFLRPTSLPSASSRHSPSKCGSSTSRIFNPSAFLPLRSLPPSPPPPPSSSFSPPLLSFCLSSVQLRCLLTPISPLILHHPSAFPLFSFALHLLLPPIPPPPLPSF